ncbi:MAG: lactate racemase domain-containing protein [Sphaerochaetaceae bacterium]|jgi:nickel-dependent lactate racemase
MLYIKVEDHNELDLKVMKNSFFEALKKIGDKQNILLIPPDITRYHGMGGVLTTWAVEYYKDKVKAILPALGTHHPMSPNELDYMFPNVDQSLFIQHNWRDEVVKMGSVPSSFIEKVSEGKLSFEWEAEVNKLLLDPKFDLILSLGQVVPHEVVGMANYTKNIFVGSGGSEGINKSHYLGAVYGMERLMGRIDSPVRAVLDYAQEHFASKLPIVYALTVVSQNKDGSTKANGLFVGSNREVFEQASRLSQKVNITLVKEALKRVVVYLDPTEYRSTWLGNKGIYRTRMALADNAVLTLIAPGVSSFGEDKEIDRLIRKYGYKGTDTTIKAVENSDELKNNLSAASHLIHGSSEGRFTIEYATPHLTKEEIEQVGYNYRDFNEAEKRYIVNNVKEGFNVTEDNEKYYFISNPALGLWATENKFN